MRYTTTRISLLLLALLLLCTACAPIPTNELVIYVPPSSYGSMIDTACRIYRRDFPEVEVTIREFGKGYIEPGLETDYEAIADYQTLLAAELNAGDGPDVILFDYQSMSFVDSYKAIKAGTFADLDPFMEADENFHYEDYVTGALDCGIYQGRRLFVPLDYRTAVVTTTRDTLEAAGLSLSDAPDAAEWDAFLTDTMEAGWGDRLLADPFVAYRWLWASGLRTFDYETGEMLVDTPEFRAIIEQIARIYVNERGDRDNTYIVEALDLLEQQESLLMVDPTVNAMNLNWLRLLDSETCPFVFSFPSASAMPVTMPGMCAAVRATSSNKANAYEFIKILLNNRTLFFLYGSLRLDSLDAEINKSRDRHAELDYLGVPYRDLTDAEVASFGNLLKNVSPPADYSTYVVRKVAEYFTPYWMGEASYDECAAKLEDFLLIYLNE